MSAQPAGGQEVIPGEGEAPDLLLLLLLLIIIILIILLLIIILSLCFPDACHGLPDLSDLPTPPSKVGWGLRYIYIYIYIYIDHVYIYIYIYT